MKRKYIWHMILILYIVFIFSNSLTVASVSSEKSSGVLELISGVLHNIGIRASWLTEHVIRKSAHFGEYAVMGILLFKSMGNLPNLGRLHDIIRYQLHISAVFFIPFVDETLQLFTEGRSGQISDVWLDMSGVISGMCLCILFVYGRKMISSRKTSEKV